MAGYVVYLITNTVNGKRYAGYSAKTLDKRWSGHLKSSRRGSSYHFHCAIRKYGAEAFVREVLFVEDTLAGAKETEILLIADKNPEYNKTLGGDGIVGYKFTDADREKIRRNTPVRSGPDHPLYGVSRPDVAERNKRSRGVSNPNMARKGENHPFYGKSRPEVVAAMHAARPEVVSDVTKAKQSASAKRRAQTEEGKQNASSAGRKGAEVRWARERARRAAEAL